MPSISKSFLTFSLYKYIKRCTTNNGKIRTLITSRSIGPLLPKILYKEDCKIVTKIVTSPKQLLYVTHDVTCNHVNRRPFRTRNFTETFSKLHENLQRNDI